LGYKLPLDGPYTLFFKDVEYDGVIIKVLPGSSPRAQCGTKFEFDGYCWYDKTRYIFGTPEFIQKAKELKADVLIPKVQKFIDSLSAEDREKAIQSMGLGLGHISTKGYDAIVTWTRTLKELTCNSYK
jgi:hypothetical protein